MACAAVVVPRDTNLIIRMDAVAKNTRGWRTGNNYITSHNLIRVVHVAIGVIISFFNNYYSIYDNSEELC